jgi:hypothetical protein
MTSRILIPALALFVVTGSQARRSGADAQYDGFQFVDAAGNIRKPPDYRDRYRILGTFMVLNAISMAAGAEPSQRDALHVRVTRDGGVLSRERKVRRWNRPGEGNSRHQSCVDDNGRRPLG